MNNFHCRTIWSTITLFIVVTFLAAASIVFCEGAPILTDQSYGVIEFGSNLKEIEQRLGEKAKRQGGEHNCNFVTFEKYPGIKFMVEEGIVTRADVTAPNIPNALGIKMGTDLAEVQRRFQKVVVEPHQYDPTGHYLIFKSSDGKRAIVFEEAGGKITDVRAGLEPSVEYVEGCL